ncbi:MAG TPA: FliA/WhiG family RNA polymerase sigma factor [Patescibacteria group bacterium]|nr:FliA/WhiG family RNA polymerase sigma factor [Patescibacteria group bacterium]
MSNCAIAEPVSQGCETHPTAQELWQRYHQKGDSPAENALVERYLPLVRSALGRLAITLPEHVDQDDLQSAGLIGLLHALRNFDPACGTAFETYARLRVRGAMLDELRRMDWVPRTVHEKARRLQQTIAQVEQRLGRVPSDSEVAKALNISTGEYGDLLTEIRPATFVCLDATCSQEGGETSSLCDIIADPACDGPLELASRNELKEIILQRLRDLPATQRKVLALYYGEDLHLREIAELLGLTESRICQIHSQAILSIRSYIQRLEAGGNRSQKS